MSDERLFSIKNPWFVGFVGGVVAIAVVAALIGFIWVPYSQGTTTIAGLWDAICTAAGASARPGSARESGAGKSVPSDVIVVPRMIAADSLSIGRGATLALRCTMCHGARGMSGANIPNLAGQNAEGIYKQLRDLQSGHRGSAIMAPHASNLDDLQMRDIAAYYASLPRATPPLTLVQQLKAPAIVQVGAPMRSIAPCASCHGSSDHKVASPVLDGEPRAYILSQLQAFANGTRHNDINGLMRNISRQMTPQEIELVADYYSRL
jgi:cytochrome c553